jgi:dual specificity protein kinase YAK1
MDQWQAYSNAPGAPRRYNSNVQQTQSHQSREYNGNGAAQPPSSYIYDQYQGGLSSTSHAQSMATSPLAVSPRDGNGDVAMQDAGDPYSGVKYPMRPHHQHHLSTGGRGPAHTLPQEQSSAAQRYSPMETLSPSAPYAASPQMAQAQYTSRQSPTKPGSYSSPNSYYGSRSQPQQLAPITPYASNSESYPPSATVQLNMLFGNDPTSPRRPTLQPTQGPPGRGPVPEFTKIRSISELQPKINAQPAFRRANPEGGFISVRLSPSCRTCVLTA